jgi:3',5'-cyclic AMP phosphodiesterase CpdA
VNETAHNLTRRQLIAAAGAVALSPALPAVAAPPGKPFRLAHLTDMHVKPEARAGEGYAAALDSLRKLDPAPDILVTGGDHVMDVMQSTRERAIVQWDLYEKVLSAGTNLPVYPVIGNHDVFGWGSKPAIEETIPGHGKAMALDRLKLRRDFYAFDAGGWHFVMLNNISRRGAAYYGEIDPEQLEWLKGDLQVNASKKPVAVFSHIPFLAVVPFFFNPKSEMLWRVRDNLLYRDVSSILPVFKQGGVKLLVSGHIHMIDRVEFEGMTFICDGAVSGNWWGGAFNEFPEGYGVFDLWPDGTFEHRFLTYGWRAQS